MSQTTTNNPVRRLLRKAGFDPARSAGEGLIVDHPRSDGKHEVSPLVIVAEESEYRVSVTVFSDGEMRPALSVTFGLPGHQPLRGQSMFGEPKAPQDAFEELRETVRRVYARSGSFHRL